MHRVVALVRPVQSTFELGCAAEVFGLRRTGIPRRYDFEVCTETPGPVPTTGGYVMHVPLGLSALDTADTVIIPGWLPVDTPLPDAVRAALVRAHGGGARLVSICSGVFALARTGLLDGRSATTHFARADRLRLEFPGIRVEAERAYIDHGDVATSAGAGAGLELCLQLVRRDHGAEHAALIARHMALPQPDRPSELLSQDFATIEVGGAAGAAGPAGGAGAAEPNDLAALLAWATERLADPLSIDALAAHLRVSPRTLARRFADQLGTSPGAWLLSRRVAAARTLLEETDLPVEAIAARVGLASAVNLRRRFRAQVGTSPGAYREAFRETARTQT